MKSLGYLHARGIIEYAEHWYRLLNSAAQGADTAGLSRLELWQDHIGNSNVVALKGLKQCFSKHLKADGKKVVNIFQKLSSNIQEPAADTDGAIRIYQDILTDEGEFEFMSCLCKQDDRPISYKFVHSSPLYKEDKAFIKAQKQKPKSQKAKKQ
jgi:hypothetical protein